VSLGRFKNCKPLNLKPLRHHGVEDEFRGWNSNSAQKAGPIAGACGNCWLRACSSTRAARCGSHLGIRTSSVVPAPRFDAMTMLPPSPSARDRMLAIP
jgi:hypothetical protein